MFEISHLTDILTFPPEILEFDKPLVIGITNASKFLYNRVQLILEAFSDRAFILALNDVHQVVRGKLKDWKEEEHKGEKLLFEMVKRK